MQEFCHRPHQTSYWKSPKLVPGFRMDKDWVFVQALPGTHINEVPFFVNPHAVHDGVEAIA